MPSRFEKYRMRDGKSPFSASYFNPIWQDIDLRLLGLEEVRASWQEAVQAVTAYGLARINEVVGPTLQDAQEKAADITAKQQLATQALAALQVAITTAQNNAIAGIAAAEQAADEDLTAWKATQLAAIQAWKDGITPSLPNLDARITTLEGRLTFTTYTYANRGQLRTFKPLDTSLAVVEGLGFFEYTVGSDEPDDDESCFATDAGRWLLVAPSWDLVDAWQMVDEDAQDVYLDTLNGRLLFGTAYSSVTSLVGAGGQASFTGAVTGAAVGDMVVATPPDALSGLISFSARVSSANTVTVTLSNPSAATASLTAGTWQLAVVKNQ